MNLEFHLHLFQSVENEPASVLSRPVDFEQIPVTLFAEQLTYVDAVSYESY